MTDTRKPDPAFVDPAEFVRRLSDKMEQDAVYVADVGQNQIWSCRNCKIREGSFLTSGGMGTMGYSIPAAMGAKWAHRADRSLQSAVTVRSRCP